MTVRPRIAIIGGGISGLSVAYELNRRGWDDFVLFEASSRLGGIVETFRMDGFVIECGPDSWVTEKPWARELAIELGLEAEIIPSSDAHRRTYLLQDDKLVAMPDGMRMMVPSDLEAIANSPLFTEEARQAYRQELARAEELKAFAAARRADEDESVASFVERHFGAEVSEKVAAPLLAGVFGGDIRQLGAAAVIAPFVNMEREHGSLVLALQKRSSLEDSQPVFTTLKNGLQSLTDGMAATIPAAAVRLEEAVLSISRRPEGWEINAATGATIFDEVVLATPVHVARGLVAPWNAGLSDLLDIEASSSVVVALAFNREQSSRFEIPEGFGFLVPQSNESRSTDSEPQLLACTFVDQKFLHRASDGCTVLRAFYGGQSAPLLLGLSDEAVLALAHRQLSRIFSGLPQAHLSFVRRWPRSLPQYQVGHLARVARIEAIVPDIPGFHLIGNAFHGVGLPDMIRQGRTTAARLLS
jgi:oxygen-dependent protoporphyrinogen oxidase